MIGRLELLVEDEVEVVGLDGEVIRENEVRGLCSHFMMRQVLMLCGLFGFCNLLHPVGVQWTQGGFIEVNGLASRGR